MKTLNILGIDIGASSGRGIIGRFDGNKLTLEEVHRFANRPVSLLSGYYWDILNLFLESKNALLKAVSAGYTIASMAIDTWSQDFALLDRMGNMLGNPHHYRDKRTDGMLDELLLEYTSYELFEMTGMQPVAICTLCQILSMKRYEKAFLENSDVLLFIPDLLSYFYTGNMICNDTLASVSMLYNPHSKTWCREILDKFEIPHFLPEITASGQMIGDIHRDISKETGIDRLPVISVAAHDSASAMASIQYDVSESIFISSGTWSVVGTLLDEPLINRNVFESGFCNETGFNGKVMFVKNITGLWVINECLKEWISGGSKPDYDYLDEHAETCGIASFVDLDSGDFSRPGNMTEKIRSYCRDTGQEIPQSIEEIYRCVVLSLALKYTQTIEELETLVGRKFNKIQITGGGARNSFLCKATSALTNRQLHAGPSEATAAGNIAVQLMTLGEIANHKEAVDMVAGSLHEKVYCPESRMIPDGIYGRYINAVIRKSI